MPRTFGSGGNTQQEAQQQEAPQEEVRPDFVDYVWSTPPIVPHPPRRTERIRPPQHIPDGATIYPATTPTPQVAQTPPTTQPLDTFAQFDTLVGVRGIDPLEHELRRVQLEHARREILESIIGSPSGPVMHEAQSVEFIPFHRFSEHYENRPQNSEPVIIREYANSYQLTGNETGEEKDYRYADLVAGLMFQIVTKLPMDVLTVKFERNVREYNDNPIADPLMAPYQKILTCRAIVYMAHNKEDIAKSGDKKMDYNDYAQKLREELRQKDIEERGDDGSL